MSLVFNRTFDSVSQDVFAGEEQFLLGKNSWEQLLLWLRRPVPCQLLRYFHTEFP